MNNYISESTWRAQRNKKEYTLFDHITVIVTDSLPENINLQAILRQIEKQVPEHLLRDVDSVYIGKFKELEERQVDSIYFNGSLLITNDQPSNKELFSTFIHEFGHAVEELDRDYIYGDNELAREFLAKRKTLYNLLKDDYPLDKRQFLTIEFTPSFDELAYKDIGYDNLGVITNGLFISPYACTSLREYFANGFEHYFLKDGREIREICPKLYRKIHSILHPDYNNK